MSCDAPLKRDSGTVRPLSERPETDNRLREEERHLAEICRRDLDRCRAKIRSVASREEPPSGTDLGAWRKMSCGERIEYVLGLQPIAYLREHVGVEAAKAFRAWWNHHMPLATFFATRIASALGVPKEHLLGDAAIGLMSALARHDPARGSIATYAKWWIFGTIMRTFARESARDVRVPVSLARNLRAIKGVQREMREAGIEPDMHDLAEATGIGHKTVRAVLAFYPRQEESLQETQVFGADQVRDEDDGWSAAGLPIEQLLPEQETPSPAQVLAHREEVELLSRSMSEMLVPREQFLLAMRFGLAGEEGQTLEEIGHAIGLSKDRVRQLCNGALFKLRRRLEIEFPERVVRRRYRSAPSRYLPSE